MSESQDPGVAVSLIWPDVEDHPVLSTNQFVAQLAPGPDGVPEELILVVGHIAPPLVLGSQEQVEALMRALGSISVKSHGRFSMTRSRLQELIQLLAMQAEKWDQALSGGQS